MVRVTTRVPFNVHHSYFVKQLCLMNVKTAMSSDSSLKSPESMQIGGMMVDCFMQWDRPQGMCVCQVVVLSVILQDQHGCRVCSSTFSDRCYRQT